MEQWVINLVYENAEIEADILKLGHYLATNSADVVNKADNMYAVMIDQLNAMKEYQICVQQRLNLIRERVGRV